MPKDKAIENFCKAFDNAKIEQKVENDPTVKNLIKQSEQFGKEVGETVNDFLRNKIKIGKPSNILPPNNQECAYIAPKEETPLYNVTTDGQKHFWQKTTDFLKESSYGIEDWDVKISTKKNNNEYSLLAGEHIGMKIDFDTKSHIQKCLNVNYNIHSEKLQANYTENCYGYSFSTSVFTRKGNMGASVSLNKKPKHLGASLSVDKENMAASLSRNINYSDKCTGKLSLYGNYSFKQKEDNVIGISYSIICK